MAKRRTVYIAVTAIALIALLGIAYFGGLLVPLGITPIGGADTTTRVGTAHCWTGLGRWNNYAELLSAPKYIGGFYASSDSEIIVVEGGVRTTCFSVAHIVEHGYRVWFRPASGTYPAGHIVPYTQLAGEGGIAGGPPGSDWVLIYQFFSTSEANAFGDFFTYEAVLTSVSGNFIGVVRAQEVVHMKDFGDLVDYGWLELAHDEATVQPGWGVLSITNPERLVQVGENLGIHYDLGAACSTQDPATGQPGNCGWRMTLRNYATGATPEGWTDKSFADFQSGTITVPVKPSWFTIGAKNEYQVKLFNQVNLQDAQLFVTIDDRNLAPGTPTVVVSPGPPYHQGDQIQVTAVSSPNPTTNNAIQSYHFLIRQGDRILVDQDSPSGIATFSIADEQVDVRIEVTAFDGERTSGVSPQTMVVEDTDQDSSPPPGSGGANLQLIAWAMIVIGIVLIIVGFLIGRLDVSLSTRAILILLGIVLLLIGILFIVLKF